MKAPEIATNNVFLEKYVSTSHFPQLNLNNRNPTSAEREFYNNVVNYTEEGSGSFKRSLIFHTGLIREGGSIQSACLYDPQHKEANPSLSDLKAEEFYLDKNNKAYLIVFNKYRTERDFIIESSKVCPALIVNCNKSEVIIDGKYTTGELDVLKSGERQYLVNVLADVSKRV